MPHLQAAKAWMTPQTERLFLAEIANEGPTDDHGVTPATVVSSIDSLLQAPDIFFPDAADREEVYRSLLGIVTMADGAELEVRDLL